MPETNMAEAYVIGERLRMAISGQDFSVADIADSLTITVSIGIAALEGAEDSADALLKRADKALYRAKRDGRNRVVSDAA
jgi:two-component system cell cycle response regulator